MTDVAGMYALGAALGAAGIGAVAGGLLQRAKRRQDAAAAALQRRQAEADQQRLAADLALEVAATARATVRAWLSGVERVLQDVHLGRTVDIDRFDEEFRCLETELTSAMYRLASATTAVPQTPTGRSTSVEPYIERVADLTLVVRSDLLRTLSGLPAVHDDTALSRLAAQVGAQLHHYASLRTEQLHRYASVRTERRRDVQLGRALLVQRRGPYSAVERLRSRLDAARADEALRGRLEKTAAAHDEVRARLTAVQKRIESNGSARDLAAAVKDAEQAQSGHGRD